MSQKIDYSGIARAILSDEAKSHAECDPSPTRVLFSWRNSQYLGAVQELYPNHSREIVILTKPPRDCDQNLIAAIRQIDAQRSHLKADDLIDSLDGEAFILRRKGEKLTFMTDEQRDYVGGRLPYGNAPVIKIA